MPTLIEPASLVEEFAAQATAQGVAINQTSMNQMMQFFCQRTTCFRNVAQRIKLDVSNIGSLTVQPWQEPADMVEMFAAQAIQGGLPMSEDGMKQMMEYFLLTPRVSTLESSYATASAAAYIKCRRCRIYDCQPKPRPCGRC